MNITKGYILQTSEGGRFAKVRGLQGESYTNVLMVYPYGFKSNIGSDDNSLCLLFSINNSKTNLFAIPYDVESSPSLKDAEASVGNHKIGSSVTFLKDGSIEVKNSSSSIIIDATGSIKLTSNTIKITGNVQVTGSLAVNNKDFTTHIHSGVTSGASNTGTIV
jgi:hypothetical protein